ncbi:MAG: hypothetical protein ACUVT5_02595 [Candidatus Bathyarchaeales archaeon]
MPLKNWGTPTRRIVEVYISSKEIITQTSIEGHPLAAGGTVHYCTVKDSLATKTEKILSKEDETVLQIIQKIAIEKKLKSSNHRHNQIP